MTGHELIRLLSSPHCPKDAEVRIVDKRSNLDKRTSYFTPEVVWWSSDRETVYLGLL